MKAEDLWMAFTDLDDEVILDAKEVQPKPKTRGRRLTTLLVAAAVMSLLTMTAFAASDSSVWFKNFFSQDSELSDSQNAYIESNTVQKPQSQTHNGYTITLESAISDGNRTFIQFKLTAPEGTVLDADYYGALHKTVFDIPSQGEGPSTSASSWQRVADDDPTDNEAVMLYTFEVSYSERNHSSFTDRPCRLLIYGLEGTYVEGEGRDLTVREENLSEGLWSFDIQFPEGSDREIEFVTEYVECPCEIHAGFVKTGDNQGQFVLEPNYVQVTSLTLRSLSADFHYKYSEKDSVNADFEEMYVVMKDGSKVLMQQASGMPNYNGYKFDTPIILDEVDHILLPDGTKLMMPQEDAK